MAEGLRQLRRRQSRLLVGFPGACGAYLPVLRPDQKHERGVDQHLDHHLWVARFHQRDRDRDRLRERDRDLLR